MKAITIHQPYATLIARGEKIFETRSWHTKHRGKIAIHAAKPHPDKEFNELWGKKHDELINGLKRLPKEFFLTDSDIIYPRGAVIATADVVECWQILDVNQDALKLEVISADGSIKKILDVSENELAFGRFKKGYYAWELRNVEILDNPIYVTGQQNLWNFTEM